MKTGRRQRAFSVLNSCTHAETTIYVGEVNMTSLLKSTCVTSTSIRADEEITHTSTGVGEKTQTVYAVEETYFT